MTEHEVVTAKSFRPRSADGFWSGIACKRPAQLITQENTPCTFGRPGLAGPAPGNPVDPRRVRGYRRREDDSRFFVFWSSGGARLVAIAGRRRPSPPPPPSLVASAPRRRSLPRVQELPHLLAPCPLSPPTGSLIPLPPELRTPPHLSISAACADYDQFYQVRLVPSSLSMSLARSTGRTGAGL